ncbi:thioredoxin family protein [Mucilaginibacter gotjawali]|uniref:Uncharacterized protein n=2 Tax=Mucilaginibacter gotjawali TaxID=1550579 RepID=A0A839SC32_9SPHI|nr:thioredoxin family protein [Mucilaginibacter gotjawali]MBB3054249.1 hypothetical protein [Mucilaginibacter gotjawali]BAU51918.1 hypothetical protein MgSA37_00067 [Mucilaginibacter gotjawali]
MIMATKMLKPESADYAAYLKKGIAYHQYKLQMAEDLVSNPDAKLKDYININLHRMQRVEKTFDISSALSGQIANLKFKINWLVLTEHWCGDASQTLSVFNKVADASNGRITMKMLYRDQNPELMDVYLTNETRSIPMLIQLDENMNVTGTWGPRPLAAQTLVKQLRSNSATAANYTTELHLWYAKDKQKSLEAEISKLIFRANLSRSGSLS